MQEKEGGWPSSLSSGAVCKLAKGTFEVRGHCRVRKRRLVQIGSHGAVAWFRKLRACAWVEETCSFRGLVLFWFVRMTNMHGKKAIHVRESKALQLGGASSQAKRKPSRLDLVLAYLASPYGLLGLRWLAHCLGLACCPTWAEIHDLLWAWFGARILGLNWA